MPSGEGVATSTRPIYRKIRHRQQGKTNFFFIECDEGWRSSIVCTELYEWAADWLLEVLGRQPFAPKHRLEQTNGRT